MMTKIRKRIYIASPYSIGDQAINVKKQIDVANQLIELGFAVYVPLLSHFLHMHNPQPYERWMEIDISFLLCCDVILRLQGKSKGADIEVKYAQGANIPVFYNIEDLKRYFQ